ncbi:hypothetical protein L6R52_16735 [Myxococcota bacterium]|nr:hypothetical protein [Myxococcota bacterium]
MMHRTLLRTLQLSVLSAGLTAALAVTTEGRADAQLEDVGDASTGGHFGLGVETMLISPFLGAGNVVNGPGGALALSYDASRFRIDGLLSLAHTESDVTLFGLGGRFFYVVDKGKTADFSVGGGLALGFADDDDGNDEDSDLRLSLEGAAQIRVFLASNVAFSTTVGLGFSFGDAPFVMGLGGQLSGALGLIYYF